MEKNDVLKIVKETFEQNIFATGCETELGFEYVVEGKEEFLKELDEKLTKLFEEKR